MADEQTTQTGGTQQSGQSSSSQGSQQTSGGANQSAAGSQTTTQNSQTGQNQTEQAAKPARPDWTPENFWDADKATIKPEFGQHFRDLSAFKAAEDSRRLTLPQKPEDYKLGLPKDFKSPDGIEFKPNENDPLLPQARAFAIKHSLTQDAFHELMGLHAAGQIGTQQTIANAKAAEVQKLGVNGTARKTAVDTYLVATLGDDLGKEMSRFTYTAKQIEGWEKIMAGARNQGAHSFNNQHRDPPEPEGKVSEEQYQKMSARERLDYVRNFPQAQFQQNNGAQR